MDEPNENSIEAEKPHLRRRVFNFFRALDQRDFARCFRYLDPTLVRKRDMTISSYANNLNGFLGRYGDVKVQLIWNKIIPPGSIRDPRTFAYVLIFWLDKKDNPHVFRERWVKNGTEWYTRVLGYVVHEPRDETKDE